MAAAVTAVERKMPRRIKRKRPLTNEAGRPGLGMEEYYDYVFPEEAGAAPNLKLLEAAMRWKRQKMTQGGGRREQEQEQEEGDGDDEQQQQQPDGDGDGNEQQQQQQQQDGQQQEQQQEEEDEDGY